MYYPDSQILGLHFSHLYMEYEMKKIIACLNVLLVSILFTKTGLAATPPNQGQITFNGAITNSTCTITTPNQVVQLPTLSASEFNAPGVKAGSTLFQIQLSGCTLSTSAPGNGGNVYAFFEAGSTVSVSTGNLKNQTSGGASNVEVGISTGPQGSGMITIGGASQNTSPAIFAVTSTGGTLTYYAQYVSTTATVGAGAFSSNVVYSLAYP